MTSRYFVWLQFDGTAYSGWQVQPNATTIQGVLNKSLATLLKQSIETVGAGRTDAGVHASSFAAHFDCNIGFQADQLADLTYKLNCILPSDIAIKKIEKVSPDTHARYGAISRTYHYLISTVKDPFLVNRAWFLFQDLDIYAMHGATRELLNHVCFESFCKANSGTSNYNCMIMDARWVADRSVLRLEITADRFLRNMVRAIVGTLVNVGLGKTTHEEFKKIIDSRNRRSAGLSVPACGLYLHDVNYPPDYIIVGNLK